MPQITKTINGNIYSTQFDSIEDFWIESPEVGNWSIIDRPGWLRLTPGETMFLMPIPEKQRNFIMIAKIDYTPVDPSDEAGIVLHKNNQDYVECYIDQPDGITYTYLKIKKWGVNFEYYVSNDKVTWTYIGSEEISPEKIGFIVKGTTVLDIDEIEIYGLDSILISNIPEGYEAKLYDSANNLLSTGVSSGLEEILLENLYTFGYIEVYDDIGTLLHITPTGPLNGGDVFDYNINIQLEVYNKVSEQWDLMQPLSILNIGYLEGTVTERKFRLTNIDTIAITNLLIKPSPVNISNNIPDNVHISLLANDMPVGYSSELLVASVLPAEAIEFNVIIERDGRQMRNINHQFYLSIKAT